MGLSSSPGTPASGPSSSGFRRELFLVLMFTTASWLRSTSEAKSGRP